MAASGHPPSPGGVVHRRIGGVGSSGIGSSSGGGSSSFPVVGSRACSGRMKPTVRQTIDSMVSTGSQSEYLSPEQTIILFDWDDTLCPSSWIRQNRPALSFFKPAPPDEKYQQPLRELSQYVEKTLKLAMTLGKVVIVTNAMDPWVMISCKHFLSFVSAVSSAAANRVRPQYL